MPASAQERRQQVIINSSMNLYSMSERCGGMLPLSQLETMRRLLVDFADGRDTNEIHEDDWLRILEEAARNA
jgi:hypothetical protein